MKKGLLSTTLALLFATTFTSTLLYPAAVVAQETTLQASEGQDYVVKSGDGLYGLGRKFFGKGVAYKKIVQANNAKAAIDSRYQVIDENQGLEVGQLIWIPVAGTDLPQTKPVVVNKPVVTESTVADQKITDKSDWPVSTESANKTQEGVNLTGSKDATITKVPKTNCDIQIWYNFQIVAIATINKRWIEMGISLEDRAKKAYTIRHNARINGRFMMQDRFEVAALRDRDNKKYGNPHGPTFEHLVSFTKEKGFTGDAVYQAIIESTSRTRPVYNSACKE